MVIAHLHLARFRQLVTAHPHPALFLQLAITQLHPARFRQLVTAHPHPALLLQLAITQLHLARFRQLVTAHLRPVQLAPLAIARERRSPPAHTQALPPGPRSQRPAPEQPTSQVSFLLRPWLLWLFSNSPSLWARVSKGCNQNGRQTNTRTLL